VLVCFQNPQKLAACAIRFIWAAWLCSMTASASTLTNMATVNLGIYPIYSLDWSSDNRFIAVGRDCNSGSEVFVLTNITLNTRHSLSLGGVDDAICVRWHPSSPYLAVGAGSIDSITSGMLSLYSFTNSSTLIFSTNYSYGGAIHALAWSANGQRLAATVNRSSGELVGFNGATLGKLMPLTTQDIDGVGIRRTVKPNTVDFRPGTTDFAIGSDYPASTPEELALYRLTTSIAELTSLSLPADSTALDWNPSGNRLAIGLSSTGLESNKLRIYSYNGTSFAAHFSTVEVKNVTSLDWDPSGGMLAAGLKSGDGTEFRLYRYDSSHTQLTEITSFEDPNTINAVRWSRNGSYIVTGDSAGNVRLYRMMTADLAVQKTASTNLIVAGSNLTYTVVVTNRGPDFAEFVEIADYLPGGMTVGSATSTMGNCTTLGSIVSCSIPLMNARTAATIVIQGIVPLTAVHSITNVASAYSEIADTNLANNTAAVVTFIDHDGDGLADTIDNCILVYNPDQADGDHDGWGNLCDNCPSNSNPTQADSDLDGVGNTCDTCPSVHDSSNSDLDSDGLGDACDNCRDDANVDQSNRDGDAYGDACDNCPDLPNDQGDMDVDDIGDACDPDNDNDGLPDAWELLYFLHALDASPTADSDGDGFDNLHEYIAGTIPVGDEGTNSFFHAGMTYSPTSRAVHFMTITGRNYAVDVTPSLLPEVVWSNWQTGIAGTGGEIQMNDVQAATNRVYRIRVILP